MEFTIKKLSDFEFIGMKDIKTIEELKEIHDKYVEPEMDGLIVDFFNNVIYIYDDRNEIGEQDD